MKFKEQIRIQLRHTKCLDSFRYAPSAHNHSEPLGPMCAKRNPTKLIHFVFSAQSDRFEKVNWLFSPLVPYERCAEDQHPSICVNFRNFLRKPALAHMCTRNSGSVYTEHARACTRRIR